MCLKLTVLSLILTVALAQLNFTKHVDEDLKTANCPLIQNYRILIEWFFDESTYIKFTDISEISDISNNIVQGLMQTPTFLVKIMLTKGAKNYAFNGTLETELKSQPIRQMIKKARQKIDYGQSRHEEPQSAALILTDTLITLDQYITRNSKHLFTHPNIHIVILVTETLETYGNNSVAAHIMHRLWKDFWIVHAFIVFHCENSEAVGYYDPFEPNGHNGTENKDDWGAMVWTTLPEINQNRNWYLNRANQFNKYPMIVSVFRRYPTSIYINELPSLFTNSYVASALKTHGGGFSGYDTLLMANLAAATNFRPVIYLSDEFGFAFPNGTFDGALGDVLDEVVDVSFTSRFIEKYGSNNIQFVLPVYSDEICVLAPSGEKIPSWTAIFRAFRLEVWLAIVFGNFACFCVWLAIKKILLKRIGHSIDNGRMVLGIFSMIIAIPTTLPRMLSERLLIGTCIISNVIIIGTFQGLLMRSFSTIGYERDIDTLQDVANSGLPIHTSSPNLINLFGQDNSTMLTALRSKYKITPSTYNALQHAAIDRNVCGIERWSDAMNIIKTYYTSPEGREELHIVRQCIRYYHLGFLVKRNSPYLDIFNRILGRFHETGFFRIWYTHTQAALLEHSQKVLLNAQQNAFFTFSLLDLQIAFYALGAGLIVSIIIFAAELTII